MKQFPKLESILFAGILSFSSISNAQLDLSNFETRNEMNLRFYEFVELISEDKEESIQEHLCETYYSFSSDSGRSVLATLSDSQREIFYKSYLRFMSENISGVGVFYRDRLKLILGQLDKKKELTEKAISLGFIENVFQPYLELDTESPEKIKLYTKEKRKEIVKMLGYWNSVVLYLKLNISGKNKYCED